MKCRKNSQLRYPRLYDARVQILRQCGRGGVGTVFLGWAGRIFPNENHRFPSWNCGRRFFDHLNLIGTACPGNTWGTAWRFVREAWGFCRRCGVIVPWEITAVWGGWMNSSVVVAAHFSLFACCCCLLLLCTVTVAAAVVIVVVVALVLFRVVLVLVIVVVVVVVYVYWHITCNMLPGRWGTTQQVVNRRVVVFRVRGPWLSGQIGASWSFPQCKLVHLTPRRTSHCLRPNHLVLSIFWREQLL